MRWLVAKEFETLIEPRLAALQRVAVVGGSPADPEVVWLLERRPDLTIEYFGVASDGQDHFTYLDLNRPYPFDTHDFDLVHCAQVLEHTWNVQQAIGNLLSLARSGGLVWINCPASCQAHGSPAYFSAGYQPELISKLAQLHGAEVLHSQRIGSPRAYFYEHTLRRWPERAEYERPLLHMTSGRGGQIRAALRWVKYLPGRVVALFSADHATDDVAFATQSLVLLRVP